jgi:hypothetical protein
VRPLGDGDYEVLRAHWSPEVWEEVMADGYTVFAAPRGAGMGVAAFCFHWAIDAGRREVHGLQGVRDWSAGYATPEGTALRWLRARGVHDALSVLTAHPTPFPHVVLGSIPGSVSGGTSNAASAVFCILAPVTAHRQADAGSDDEPDARTVLRWRVVPVFDYSQTEGTDLPPHPCQTLTTGSERGRWLFARLLGVARAEGIGVWADIRGLGTAHGAYVPGARVIALAPGLSDDQRAKTLAHELGHALLLHGHGDPRREEEAAEAEVVALVVTTWDGLDTSGYSFGYVADWVGRKDGAALVRRVGATVQKAAAAIMRRLAPEETNNSA